jgi:hypothetical protein
VTATVALPGGGEAFTVGSGIHSWTVPAPAAAPAPRELDWGRPLSDVVDDRAAYTAVMAAIASVAPEAAMRLRRQSPWAIRRTLGEALAFMPPAAKAAVAAALESLNARTGDTPTRENRTPDTRPPD